MPLIEVQGLKTYFHLAEGVVRAVDRVDFTIEPGRTLGVVGESGSGKSVTALSILGLVASPPGRLEGGEIRYHRRGEVLHLERLDPRGPEMRSIRGCEIAMIFQEPAKSLNPIFSIGRQLTDAIALHQRAGRKEAREKALEMLRAVGIPSPERRLEEYPHELSGGMCQRVMIAIALACRPFLLIADEPTTALDVTTQAQVLELMNQLRAAYRMAIQFITHDLALVAGMADEVIVMYLGRIMEAAGVRELFHEPLHPYTQGLLRCVPSLADRSKVKVPAIEGTVPDPLHPPAGCGFQPRCPRAMEVCSRQAPPPRETAPGHRVACWLFE